MTIARNECPVHGQPRFAHILSCAHRGAREVWLSDQGDGTYIVYDILDIAARERAYDAMDRWIDGGILGGFEELERLHAAQRAVERMSRPVDRDTSQQLFDAAVANLMAGVEA